MNAIEKFREAVQQALAEAIDAGAEKAPLHAALLAIVGIPEPPVKRSPCLTALSTVRTTNSRSSCGRRGRYCGGWGWGEA